MIAARIPLLVVVAAGLAGCETKEGCDALVQYYEDRDGDGYGNPDELQATCEAPDGYVAISDDCDDRDADRYPGATEICGDGEINDCAGSVEDAAAQCAVSGDVGPDTSATATITGEAGMALGSAVANAGDIDRDDVADLLIGGPGDDTSGTDAGAVWVFYGGQSGELEERDASSILTGEAAGDQAGAGVGTPGDINGDGDSDILVGAPGAEDGAGRVYLILQDLSSEIPLSEADVIFTGDEAGLGAGALVSGVGDFNGDDGLDFLIASPTADDDAGRLWLITSYEEGGSLADYDRQIYGGAAGDAAGSAILGADLDGDGDDDLVVGAPHAAQTDTSGNSYVNGAFFGILETFIEPISLEDADTRLYGEMEDDGFGTAMASLGDIDGDGYADFAMSSPGQGWGGLDSGAVYVIPGPVGIHSFMVVGNLAIARIDGHEPGQAIGDAIAGPGDVDGDGLADLAIGSVNDATVAEGSGAVYTIFGPISGEVGVSMDEGQEIGVTAAIHYVGSEANAALGSTLVGAGDQGGDAGVELLAGAPGAGSGAGAAYVLRASGY